MWVFMSTYCNQSCWELDIPFWCFVEVVISVYVQMGEEMNEDNV